MKRSTTLGLLATASALGALGVRDYIQTKHSILRNFPVLGHARFLLESIRPEIQQYFIESDWDGRPFNRDQRSLIYERAKHLGAEHSFGTLKHLESPGTETFLHSMHPAPVIEGQPRHRLGGPACTQPYDISLFNVSSMSFGALSANAVMAMNKGAKLGGFSQETGEGGLTKYHLKYGADIIWEFGSGYFGCRNADGTFSLETFTPKANRRKSKRS